jgi:Fe-S-cluster containining protein
MKLTSESLLPYLCQSTGKCCIHNIVILSPFDIFRIAKALNLSAKNLFKNKILTYRINSSSFWMEPILNSKKNQTCPFLETSSKKYICEIYEERPFVCRIFPLKYDPDEESFMRLFVSEERCRECIDVENLIKTEDYLQQGNIPALLEEFKTYSNLLDKILEHNYTIEGIKNKKDKQSIFFQIQSMLYETYPMNPEYEEAYPFEQIKAEIESLLEI